MSASPTPLTTTDARLRQTSFGLLLALALVLPVFEAPKNLLLALLAMVLLVMLAVQAARRQWSLCALDAALIALVGASAFSTWANLPFENAGKGLKDVAGQLVVCMVAIRAGLSRRQIGALAVAATCEKLDPGVARMRLQHASANRSATG